MSAVFSKQAFTADSTGLGILVVGTSSGTATTVHTVPSTTFDEIWIYATNNDTVTVNLTIEFGDSTNVVTQGIPSKSGLTIILPGLILGTGKIVKAYAGTTNKISVFGYVNRIS